MEGGFTDFHGRWWPSLSFHPFLGVRFWLTVIHYMSSRIAIPEILTDGISEYSDTAAKADLFNKYFQSVFNQDIFPTHLNVENTRTENMNLSSIEFDHLQIQKILSGLDAN